MITVRLTGIHLAIGLRLETSLWIILIGCLKLQKFINELEITFQMRLTHRSLNKNNQQDDRAMLSSLDGLRHSTSCAISSNVNRQPQSTFVRNQKELRHSNPGVQVRPLSHQFGFRIPM